MADLDESFAALRALDVEALDLHPFQREMVLDALRYS
jgi:hypothetical protein